MPEQKLNLLQFSAGEVAQASATPSPIYPGKRRRFEPAVLPSRPVYEPRRTQRLPARNILWM
jgi:hypothetical protein